MKVRFFYFFFISTLVGCNQPSKLLENEYEVTVKAEGVFDGLRAYLKTNEDPRNIKVTDTAIVYNGTFRFKGQIEGTQMRAITIDGVNGQATILLEPGKILVKFYKDSVFKSTIKGPLNNTVFNDYKKQYSAKIDDLNFVRKSLIEAKNDQILSKNIKNKRDSLKIKIKNFRFHFIKENPSTDFSLLLLNSAVSQRGFDVSLATEAYDAIENNIKTKTIEYQIISNRIKILLKNTQKSELVSIGKKAPNFIAQNPKGELIELNKIKGKVTIIDFWASWCKPCRAENPNLVKLYNKYQTKGLEIISISLDKKSQELAWIKAIEKDQLNWYNVSNLKFWKDPIAQLYGVNSIPATFIIDEEGNLIDKQLRSKQLYQKIKELLD